MISSRTPSIPPPVYNLRAISIGAPIWIFAIQFFIVQLVAQLAWTTPFSLAENFISDLGNTTCGPYPPGSTHYVCSPLHPLMNASFIVLGGTIIAGAIILRGIFPPGRLQRAGILLLVLAGIGNAMVGLFTEDGNITLHRIGAVDHFILGNLSMVLLGLDLWQGRSRKLFAIWSILCGLVGLVATLLFVQGHYLGTGIGGMERLAAYPVPIWMIATGISLAARNNRLP